MQITAEIELAALALQVTQGLSPLDVLALVEGLVRRVDCSDGGRRLNATMARLGYVPAEALELAACRLDFAANWIENSYGGDNKSIQSVRAYAQAARAVVERGEVR